MNTYTNRKRPTILRYDDEVLFTLDIGGHFYTMKYLVAHQAQFLYTADGMMVEDHGNRWIFDMLKLDANEFAEQAYGGHDDGSWGSWPTYRRADSGRVMANLVRAIYEEIERQAGKI